MPSLSNDQVRQKNMLEFLDAMHIPAEGIQVSSIEGLYCFSSQESTQLNDFTAKLLTAIQGKDSEEVIAELSLSKILADELVHAQCTDELDRTVCQSILKKLKATQVNILYSQDKGEIHIKFPKASYVKLFRELTYLNLKFPDSKTATLDIKPLLKNITQKIIRIENINPALAPILFLNSAALENKMFYAINTLPDGNSEVQPFFFVPASTTPPQYHFVLDTSGSMLASLDKLIASVLQLAEQLFDFQPDASIRLLTFSNKIEDRGLYSRQMLPLLKNKVRSIQAEGATPLYKTTSQLLEEIQISKAHNNVLLFTDGMDSELDRKENPSDLYLKRTLNKVKDTAHLAVKNKFTVFCYNIKPDALMTEVSKAFNSKIVETQDADFMKALQDPQVMKEWAAARSLFTTTIMVDSSSETYTVSIDHYGQLEKLKPLVGKPGDLIAIKIKDGDGKKILSSRLTLDLPAIEQKDKVAESLSNIGFLAAPKGAPESQPAPELTNSL